MNNGRFTTLKSRFPDFFIRFLARIAFSFLFTLTYLYIVYFAVWWVAGLARFLIIATCIALVISWFRKRRLIRRLSLVSPAIVICYILTVVNANDYLGSFMEYQIRKNDFKHDVRMSRQSGNPTSVLRWTAWSSDVMNMREFVYSEIALPQEFPMEPGSGDCRKFGEKLDGDFYIVYFSGCSGPLF
jgi:hypothetical protein